ncbi:hypothetical protein JTL65_34175, partial [Pseudomonas aeruginosa]|nr:hypothetical protein [Pseudomonas aeruginosa]
PYLSQASEGLLPTNIGDLRLKPGLLQRALRDQGGLDVPKVLDAGGLAGAAGSHLGLCRGDSGLGPL